MTLLAQIKAELRISHSSLDGLLDEHIKEARSELFRAGISADVVNAEGPLVKRAIKDYVLARNSEGDTADRYEKAFGYECDCIRKSSPEAVM